MQGFIKTNRFACHDLHHEAIQLREHLRIEFVTAGELNGKDLKGTGINLLKHFGHVVHSTLGGIVAMHPKDRQSLGFLPSAKGSWHRRKGTVDRCDSSETIRVTQADVLRKSSTSAHTGKEDSLRVNRYACADRSNRFENALFGKGNIVGRVSPIEEPALFGGSLRPSQTDGHIVATAERWHDLPDLPFAASIAMKPNQQGVCIADS